MLFQKKTNQKTNLKVWVIIAIMAVFSFSHFTQANVNKQINYQGKLTSNTGVYVPDGDYDVVFKLYTVSSGGTAIWTGNYNDTNGNPVPVVGGIMNVLLGTGPGNSLDNISFTGDTYYLGITINTDAEMTPRKRLGAAPQAINSNSLIGDGLIRITGSPIGNNLSEGTAYINPQTVNSGETLLGIAVNGAQRFKVDEQGNVTTAGSLTASGNLMPSADDTYDLGSPTRRWRDFYLGPTSLHIGEDGDDAIISYNTVTDMIEFSKVANVSGTATNITGIAAPANGGTGLNTASSTGLPTLSSGTWSIASNLGVTLGGTGTTTQFTPGSLVFAGTDGIYSQDNGNLFWDNSGKRLGVGTASPYAYLQVEGSSAITNIASIANPSLVIRNSNTTAGALNAFIFSNSGGYGSAAIFTSQTQTGNFGDNLSLQTKNATGSWNSGQLVLSTLGNIGISNISPNNLLTLGAYNSGTSSTFKQGLLSVDNSLLAQLEGGSYFGRTGLTENQWKLNNFGNTWTTIGAARVWTSIAMSSDGRVQTAGVQNGQIYVSTDYGISFIARDSARYWYDVSMSADGKIQSAVTNSGGAQIYVSTNYGLTWTVKDSVRGWTSITVSSDGKTQAATVSGGQIYVSTDYGNTWTAKDSNRSWTDISMSSDGKVQSAIVNSGQIYVSTDYGNTWAAKDSSRSWIGIAISSDGKIQTAANNGGQIYVSTDYGNTWTAKDSNRNWSSVAMSSDGKIQTTVVYGGQIYVSTDYGNTWTAKNSARDWESVAMSSDGKVQSAVVSDPIIPTADYIYVSHADSYMYGNVGIGTNAPTARLQIGTLSTPASNETMLSLGGTISATAGANPKLKIYDAGGANWFGIGVSSAQMDYSVLSSSDHVFYGGANELFRIDGATGRADFKGSGVSEIVNIGTATQTTYTQLLLTGDTGTGSIFKNGSAAASYGGSGSFNIYNSQDAPITFYHSTTERMRINTGGNVGIGTAAPQSTLDLGNGSGGRSIVWGGANGTSHYASMGTLYSLSDLFLGSGIKADTTAANLLYSWTGTAGVAGNLYDYGEGDTLFFNKPSAAVTAGSVFDYATNTKMIIKSSGNVGIGTTAPDGLLEVGNSATYGNRIIVTNVGTGTTAYADLSIRNSSGLYDGLRFNTFGSGYTTSGYAKQDGASIFSGGDLSGGLSLVAGAAGADMRFYTNGSADANQRMIIDSAGNVGIGATSPGNLLHIQKDQNAPTRLQISNYDTGIGTQAVSFITNSATANYYYADGLMGTGFTTSGLFEQNKAVIATGSQIDGINIFTQKATAPIIFGTSTTERMRIDGNGNVGIGATTLLAKFHINSADPILLIKDTDTSQTTANSRLRLAESGASDILDGYWDLEASPNSNAFDFHISDNVGGKRMTILKVNGNVGIGTVAPNNLLTLGAYNSGIYSTFKQGLFSVDNSLLAQLEGGSYFGGVGIKESQWGLNNFANTWTVKESNRLWSGLAMSSDGKIQTATVWNGGGQIYVSSDYGNTWAPKGSSLWWYDVAMSADGKIQLTAAAANKIYVSTDYGNTWTSKDSNRTWYGVAMSSDGKIQAALAGEGGQIYISTDYGNTWTAKDSNRNWIDVAMSSDGKIQSATVNGGQIYVSTDYGNTWTAKDSARTWKRLAMSSDGKIQTAAADSAQIYVSNDYGNTWTARDSSRTWFGVAMSSDGKIQTATVTNGQIYSSINYGSTWTAKDSTRWWEAGVAVSSDGKTQATAVGGGQIYVSHADSYQYGNVGIGTGSPSTKLTVAAAATGGLYVGNGTFNNPEGWNQVIDLQGVAHSRIEARTATVNMGMYAHDSWTLGGAAGYIGTYTNHPIGFQINALTKMILNTSGNVGIGTITPTNILSLGNTQNQKFWIENTANTVAGRDLTIAAGSTVTAGTADMSGGNLILTSGLGKGTGASTISFQTGTTLTTGSTLQTMSTKMTILGDGNVGIGTTSPGAKLDIGLAGTSLGTLRLAGNTSGYVQIQPAAAAGSWTMTLPAAVGGAGQQLTDVSGNGITSWAAAGSLRNLKNIDNQITDPTTALNQLLSTNIYNFHYKKGMGTGDSDTQYVGVMADEASWAMHYDGNIINPVNTLGYMVLGVQALDNKIVNADINLQDLSLKTSQNITTLTQLQASIDTQLGIVQISLAGLQETNDEFQSDLDLAVQTLQDQITELQNQTNQELNTAQIDQNTADISYLKTLLGINSNKPNEISITGKLIAENIETGIMTINIVNEDSATIGTAIICPEGFIVDATGKCTVEDQDGDGKSVVVKTGAVSKEAKVFVTIKSRLNKDVTLMVTDIVDRESFKVELINPTEEAVMFDWWIVETK